MLAIYNVSFLFPESNTRVNLFDSILLRSARETSLLNSKNRSILDAVKSNNCFMFSTLNLNWCKEHLYDSHYFIMEFNLLEKRFSFGFDFCFIYNDSRGEQICIQYHPIGKQNKDFQQELASRVDMFKLTGTYETLQPMYEMYDEPKKSDPKNIGWWM